MHDPHALHPTRPLGGDVWGVMQVVPWARSEAACETPHDRAGTLPVVASTGQRVLPVEAAEAAEVAVGAAQPEAVLHGQRGQVRVGSGAPGLLAF